MSTNTAVTETPEDTVLRAARRATNEASRRFGPVLDMDDAFSDAMYGAVQALQSWRSDGGASLYTHAHRRAGFSIIDGVRSRGTLTRGETSAKVTLDELPEQRRPAVSLDAMASVDDDIDHISSIGRIDKGIAEVEARLTVQHLFTLLSDRERLVLRCHDIEGQSLATVGRQLGVSESRVCQIRTAVLAKLRTYLESGIEPQRKAQRGEVVIDLM